MPAGLDAGVHLAKRYGVVKRSSHLSTAAGVVVLSLALAGGSFVFGSTAGCRRGVPVIDTNPEPAGADGTISGRVTGLADAARLAGRRVDAIELTTGRKVGVSTSSMGAFSIKVPPGKYRLVVELRDGEALASSPGPIEINKSDLDHDIELVVTAVVSRPRQSDSMRGTDGLGAPIA
jgi:hypothetical protein